MTLSPFHTNISTRCSTLGSAAVYLIVSSYHDSDRYISCREPRTHVGLREVQQPTNVALSRVLPNKWELAKYEMDPGTKRLIFAPRICFSPLHSPYNRQTKYYIFFRLPPGRVGSAASPTRRKTWCTCCGRLSTRAPS